MTLTATYPLGLVVAVKDIRRGGYEYEIKVQAASLGPQL